MRRRWSRGVAVIALALAFGAAPGWAATTRSVRTRDWRNGEYDLGGRRVVFAGGRHEELDHDRSCSVCLTIREVTFGDVDGDGTEEAILLIDSNLGGAGTSLDAYIFGLVDDQPRLRAQIEGGDRGEGGLQSVSVASGDVMVRRFQSAPEDGACCPSRVLVERWRWRNGQLAKEPGAPRVRKRRSRPWYLRP
jgi:hypothetical protein